MKIKKRHVLREVQAVKIPAKIIVSIYIIVGGLRKLTFHIYLFACKMKLQYYLKFGSLFNK